MSGTRAVYPPCSSSGMSSIVSMAVAPSKMRARFSLSYDIVTSYLIEPKAMPIANENLLRVTCALRRPETALAAAEALRGRSERAAVEGLVELLYAAPAPRLAIAAIDALEDRH